MNHHGAGGQADGEDGADRQRGEYPGSPRHGTIVSIGGNPGGSSGDAATASVTDDAGTQAPSESDLRILCRLLLTCLH